MTSNQNTASNQNQENEKSVLLSCLDKPSSPYLYADEQISVELFIHLSTIFILLLIFTRPHCALEQFLDSQTYSRTRQGKPVFTKVFLRGLLKGCLRQKKKTKHGLVHNLKKSLVYDALGKISHSYNSSEVYQRVLLHLPPWNSMPQCQPQHTSKVQISTMASKQ